MTAYFRRRSKYGAVKTCVDGHVFASQAEARRYGELLLLQKAGEITDLECQPRFPLRVNGVVVAHYVGDFRYRKRDAALVVEDVKGGPVTPVFALKRKMVEAQYGIQITEVRYR